ncbi:hydroxyphenylacetyl-CoA thioesterase PaaI [Piscinibacter sp.]|jgi:acyl-CoA thioesterase|uniref:hydroxyphenylacetyl-CoA thioesterase PaaI n=1 Tax=Piscinibacter sp. TaxID=1903157 RepID=UPI0035599044
MHRSRPTDDAAQRTAERVRDCMLAADAAAHALGMQVSSIGPGCAVVTMAVRADMLNGFGICQGGLVTTLADAAFAYACNSYNVKTVASGFSVDLLAPGREGDVLTARADVVSQSGRTGVYDAEVSNQNGERIAMFRGRSYRLQGKPVVGDAEGAGAP